MHFVNFNFFSKEGKYERLLLFLDEVTIGVPRGVMTNYN
jgi:hypothetical protein